MGDKSKCAKKKRVVAAPMPIEVAVDFASVAAGKGLTVASAVRQLICKFMEEERRAEATRSALIKYLDEHANGM